MWLSEFLLFHFFVFCTKCTQVWLQIHKGREIFVRGQTKARHQAGHHHESKTCSPFEHFFFHVETTKKSKNVQYSKKWAKKGKKGVIFLTFRHKVPVKFFLPAKVGGGSQTPPQHLRGVLTPQNLSPPGGRWPTVTNCLKPKHPVPWGQWRRGVRVSVGVGLGWARPWLSEHLPIRRPNPRPVPPHPPGWTPISFLGPHHPNPNLRLHWPQGTVDNRWVYFFNSLRDTYAYTQIHINLYV